MFFGVVVLGAAIQSVAACGDDSGGGSPAGGDDEVRDEVRLDLDEEKLDTWEDVRGDYATDPESDVARPALTDEEGAGTEEGADTHQGADADAEDADTDERADDQG